MVVNITQLVNNRNKKNQKAILETFYFIIQNVPWTQMTLRRFCWNMSLCLKCTYFNNDDTCIKCKGETKRLWESINILEDEYKDADKGNCEIQQTSNDQEGISDTGSIRDEAWEEENRIAGSKSMSEERGEVRLSESEPGATEESETSTKNWCHTS